MARPRTLVLPPEIEQVVQQTVARFRPSQVLLFGSYAYGEPHEGSDVDLLVVTSDPPSREEGYRIAHEVGRSLPVSLQLVFMTPEEYEETKDVVGGLAYPAHHWGRVLYAAQPRAGDPGLRSGVAGEG